MNSIFKIIAFCFLNLLLFSCQHKKIEVVEESYDNKAPRLVRYYEEKNGNKVLVGEKDYYPDSKIQLEGSYKNDKRDGTWIFYYKNGNKWSEAEYIDGINNGKTLTWFENGNKRYEGFYKDGKQSGKWKFWDEKGNFVKEVNY